MHNRLNGVEKMLATALPLPVLYASNSIEAERLPEGGLNLTVDLDVRKPVFLTVGFALNVEKNGKNILTLVNNFDMVHKFFLGNLLTLIILYYGK